MSFQPLESRLSLHPRFFPTLGKQAEPAPRIFPKPWKKNADQAFRLLTNERDARSTLSESNVEQAFAGGIARALASLPAAVHCHKKHENPQKGRRRMFLVANFPSSKPHE